MQGVRNARIKATNEIVQVYLHSVTGCYINALDCKTTYFKHELEFF